MLEPTTFSFSGVAMNADRTFKDIYYIKMAKKMFFSYMRLVSKARPQVFQGPVKYESFCLGLMTMTTSCNEIITQMAQQLAFPFNPVAYASSHLNKEKEHLIISHDNVFSS